MKAVLVVDIPDYIDDISKVELAYGLYFRKRFDGESIDPTDILEYHEVYPLRPLPEKQKLIVTGKNQIEKKKIIESKSLEWIKKGYINNPEVAFYCGYNACLDDITGEKE